jgi:DNA-binding transcriptional regulator YiaG
MTTRWRTPEPTTVSPTRLLAARQQLQMTRADLAYACRVSVSTVYEWETSAEPIHIPPFSTLRVLHQIIALAPHLAARRSNPDWTL